MQLLPGSSAPRHRAGFLAVEAVTLDFHLVVSCLCFRYSATFRVSSRDLGVVTSLHGFLMSLTYTC